MSKNPKPRNAISSNNKKGSYSHDPSPLHSSKPRKETNNCFQPSELESQLKMSSKTGVKKPIPKHVTTNVFINNLNVQINASQMNQKKSTEALSASITNRKNSKQYSVLGQKEEISLAESRNSKSRQKLRTPQTSFDGTINPHVLSGGASYELTKNPLALIPRHHSEVLASNDVTKSNYIPKFKGTDPTNKFPFRSPPKVLSQPDSSTKFKKPNKSQKSFDANAGGPLGKYTPYLNSYLKPPATANNSPRTKETEVKPALNENNSRLAAQNNGTKGAKSPLEKNLTSSKGVVKPPLIISKHRKTPSFDLTKRSENIEQKTMTPPILERSILFICNCFDEYKVRKSADCGDYWQRELENFNNNKSYRFAIRTRAGVAPNGTRKINQDSFIFHTNFGKKSDRYLLGVCDGHGMNGHFVSSFIKDTLPVCLLGDPNFETNIALAFTNAFELCQQKLSVCDFDCRFSGTTTAVVLIDGDKIITANAGDSRAILGFYDKGWDCVPLTNDHKPNNPQEAQRIMKCGGRIEPFKDMEGNFVGPSRVWLLNQDIPGLAMSRSIGDFVAASVGVSCIPEIKEFKINSNDKFLIVASDGVWEFIESIDVTRIIAPFYEQNNIEGACDFLLGLALKSWQEEEEVVVDDITLIIVFF